MPSCDAVVLRRHVAVLRCELSRRLSADCDQNLGDDLVDEFQVRPTNPNHFPARAFEVSLATLLGLNAVVDLIDGVPVFDSPVELDGNLQVGQRNIDEVRMAIDVDFLLSGHAVDTRAQQCEQDEGLARRLASSVSAVNDPSGALTSDGVEGSVSQCLVELFARLLLADT